MSNLFELKTQLIAPRSPFWDSPLGYARWVGRREITLAALPGAPPTPLKEAGDAT